MTTATKHLDPRDLEIATFFKKLNPQLSRAEFGTLLAKEGLGVNHHTHSGCYDRIQYINLALDSFPDFAE